MEKFEKEIKFTRVTPNAVLKCLKVATLQVNVAKSSWKLTSSISGRRRGLKIFLFHWYKDGHLEDIC